MGARNNFLAFFTRENIEANKMDLGMSVLAGVGCRHFDDFAGTALHHHVAILSQSRADHFVSQRVAISKVNVLEDID